MRSAHMTSSTFSTQINAQASQCTRITTKISMNCTFRKQQTNKQKQQVFLDIHTKTNFLCFEFLKILHCEVRLVFFKALALRKFCRFEKNEEELEGESEFMETFTSRTSASKIKTLLPNQ